MIMIIINFVRFCMNDKTRRVSDGLNLYIRQNRDVRLTRRKFRFRVIANALFSSEWEVLRA